MFYSHVNFSVTKIILMTLWNRVQFYSHVNFSVTKMCGGANGFVKCFTVT